MVKKKSSAEIYKQYEEARKREEVARNKGVERVKRKLESSKLFSVTHNHKHCLDKYRSGNVHIVYITRLTPNITPEGLELLPSYYRGSNQSGTYIFESGLLSISSGLSFFPALFGLPRRSEKGDKSHEPMEKELAKLNWTQDFTSIHIDLTEKE